MYKRTALMFFGLLVSGVVMFAVRDFKYEPGMLGACLTSMYLLGRAAQRRWPKND